MSIDRRLRNRWRSCIRLCLLALVALAGCGGGESGVPRFDLTGTVTYDGRPVPAGYIEFAPDSTQGNSGPGTSAEIRDGRYTTLPGRGTIGGSHIVTLRGFGGVRSPRTEGSQKPPIPQSAGGALFTAEVKLDLPEKQSVHDFEIPKQ